MMTHIELKQVILECIRDLYKTEYVGGLKIEDLDPEGYKISLNLDRGENPLVIIADLSDEDFISFIREELRSRKLQRVQHVSVTKLPPKNLAICKTKN